MNRRRFLKIFTAGAAATVVAPHLFVPEKSVFGGIDPNAFPYWRNYVQTYTPPRCQELDIDYTGIDGTPEGIRKMTAAWRKEALKYPPGSWERDIRTVGYVE